MPNLLTHIELYFFDSYSQQHTSKSAVASVHFCICRFRKCAVIQYFLFRRCQLLNCVSIELFFYIAFNHPCIHFQTHAKKICCLSYKTSITESCMWGNTIFFPSDMCTIPMEKREGI